MATLKRRQHLHLSRAQSADPPSVVLMLARVLDGPRPGCLDPAADAAWCQLRARLFRAELGTNFDPRFLLEMREDQKAEWHAEKREWARQLFANDPRVLP